LSCLPNRIPERPLEGGQHAPVDVTVPAHVYFKIRVSQPMQEQRVRQHGNESGSLLIKLVELVDPPDRAVQAGSACVK